MNKFFKTIFACVLAALPICLTACSSTTSTTLGGSYFLENTGNTDIIANIDETNEYYVTFTPDSSAAVQASLSDESGFNVYTTRLTSGTYNDTSCYILETQLKTKITYTIGSEEYGPYEDTISTKAYFLSVSDKLKTLYSERSVVAHSPVYDTDLSSYIVHELSYTITSTYGDSSATVNFSTDTETDYYGITAGDRVYDGYNSSQYYFDNEIMLFVPRAIKLTSSSSLSFSTIDALSGKTRTLTLASDSSEPTEDIVFSSDSSDSGVNKYIYYVNGKKMFIDSETGNQKITCNAVSFEISGTFSGSSIDCRYADTSIEGARARLIRMQTTAMNSMGTFTYNIYKTTISG